MNKKNDIQNLAREVLETAFWPEGVQTKVSYHRTHDDCDGDYTEGIAIAFTQDGDAWVQTVKKSMGMCRYREPCIGGGLSPRVRNALLLLALAIKLDNENGKFEYTEELDVSCPNCGGEGSFSGADDDVCSVCMGSGVISKKYKDEYGL